MGDNNRSQAVYCGQRFEQLRNNAFRCNICFTHDNAIGDRYLPPCHLMLRQLPETMYGIDDGSESAHAEMISQNGACDNRLGNGTWVCDPRRLYQYPIKTDIGIGLALEEV